MLRTTTLNELLGEQLLEHNESNNELNQISINELNGKGVGLYFATYSSSACRNFTPKLAAYYKGFNSNDEIEKKLEIVYISYDKDQATFDEHFKKMPWKALPFSGKRLFRSRESRDDEYVWDGIIFHQCYMSPIIGSRHGCIEKEECYVDLCETCLPKTKHEHHIIEYLIPKRQYSFEQLFKTVSHLLNPNSEEKIETKTIWENGVKSQANSLPFRIVLVSSDYDKQSFHEYRSKMPWPAIPLGSSHLLHTYFQSCYIPRFYIVSSDGKVLSRRGVDDVTRKSIEALKTWIQGETVAPRTADEFEWDDVSCNGCNMNPIIGQRYRCSTCEKKGHEHPLELVPQSTEDED
ncbi:unnamed protein product [Rotaria sordida]|uniref:protein-disulfide reductase n=1 Tax=Rotaria sordida TaxID=392033 RepID=A0A819HLB7_9BILA|nr:unnamed protein product [Rotaria sordida]